MWWSSASEISPPRVISSLSILRYLLKKSVLQEKPFTQKYPTSKFATATNPQLTLIQNKANLRLTIHCPPKTAPSHTHTGSVSQSPSTPTLSLPPHFAPPSISTAIHTHPFSPTSHSFPKPSTPSPPPSSIPPSPTPSIPPYPTPSSSPPPKPGASPS